MKKPRKEKRKVVAKGKLDASFADFLLKPVIEAVSEDCKEWKQGVRLLSYGLLTPTVEKKITAHVKQCSACRLFLLDCINTQRIFLRNNITNTLPVADKLSTGKDALVKVFPTSKTRRDIPLAPRNWEPEQEAVVKELKNEKE